MELPTTNKLLTVRDIVEQLNISESTANRLLRTGQIASLKIGRARRITPEALNNFITLCQRSGEISSLVALK